MDSWEYKKKKMIEMAEKIRTSKISERVQPTLLERVKRKIGERISPRTASIEAFREKQKKQRIEQTYKNMLSDYNKSFDKYVKERDEYIKTIDEWETEQKREKERKEFQQAHYKLRSTTTNLSSIQSKRLGRQDPQIQLFLKSIEKERDLLESEEQKVSEEIKGFSIQASLALEGFEPRLELGGLITDVIPEHKNDEYIFTKDYRVYDPKTQTFKKYKVTPVTETKYYAGLRPKDEPGWYGAGKPFVSKEEYEKSFGKQIPSKYAWDRGTVQVPVGYKQEIIGKGTLDTTESFKKFKTYKGTDIRLLSVSPSTSFYYQDPQTRASITQVTQPYRELKFEEGHVEVITRDVKFRRMSDLGVPLYDEKIVSIKKIPIKYEAQYTKFIKPAETQWVTKGNFNVELARQQRQKIVLKANREFLKQQEQFAKQLGYTPKTKEISGRTFKIRGQYNIPSTGLPYSFRSIGGKTYVEREKFLRLPIREQKKLKTSFPNLKKMF